MDGQDFSVEDTLDEPRFNRALWQGLKDAPYPSERLAATCPRARQAAGQGELQQR